MTTEEVPPATAEGGRRQLANGGLATGAAVVALYSHETALRAIPSDGE